MDNNSLNFIFGVLTALLSIIAIVLASIQLVISIRKRSLSYEIISIVPMIRVNQYINNQVVVLFEGMPVQGIVTVVIRLINSGNEAIRKDDYERRISFSFGESKILNAELLSVNPPSLSASIEFLDNCIYFEPILLNSRDYMKFSVLLAEFEGKIVPDGRIVGVHEITQINSEEQHAYHGLYLGLAIIVVTLITCLLFLIRHEYLVFFTLLSTMISAFISILLISMGASRKQFKFKQTRHL